MIEVLDYRSHFDLAEIRLRVNIVFLFLVYDDIFDLDDLLQVNLAERQIDALEHVLSLGLMQDAQRVA